MSSIINIYEPDADDFDCEGLGTLRPLDWDYLNKGAAGAVLTITHPYDAEGRWQLIQAGRVIRADVPVRTVPEIENGALVATAEVWTVKAGATKAQRYIYSKAKSGKGKKKKLVPAGAQVTVTKKGDDRYAVTYRAQVTSKKKLVWKAWSGWMEQDALDVKIEDLDTSTVAKVEKAIPSVQVRPQLFRLQEPKRGEKQLTVEALPIAYDAAGILTDPYTQEAVTGPEVLEAILEGAYLDTDLELYTDIGDSRTGFEKRNVNLIDALLNGDESFVGRFGGDVLLDDYAVTILRNAGVDRGFYATYGRNLTGIDSYEVTDDIVTALLPVGEDANGNPLYLTPDKIVYAPNYAQFPTPHMAELKVSEAKVDKKSGVTPAIARTRLSAAAQAEWDKGVHIPGITLKIKFAFLGDSEEYAQFRAIDQCHMYDIVHVWHPLVCGTVDMAVSEARWNGMRERYTEMTLGTPGEKLSTARISAGRISGGISGRQIAWNTVGAGQLADDCVSARHVQADSINAEAIQAESITADHLAAHAVDTQSLTAVKAAINDISATNIHTNTLAAAFASLFSVVAGKISAREIEVGKLDAIVENVVTLTAGSADFDVTTVQHLVSSVLQATVLTSGLARIENLYVTQANLMNATLDRLTLLAADGETYYDIGVGTDGSLTATVRDPATVNPTTGTTTDGRNVLDASGMEDDPAVGYDVPSLDGLTIQAGEDGLLWVYQQALSVGKLRAVEAFIGSAEIPSLQATVIEAVGNSMTFSANQVIQMLIGVADGVRAWFTFGQDGLVTRKTGSKWSTRVAEDGYYIDHDDVIGHVGAFYKESANFRSLQVTKKAGQTNTDIRVRPTSTGGWVWTD